MLLLAVLSVAGPRFFIQDRLVELTHLDPQIVDDSSMLVVIFHPFSTGREAMSVPAEIIKDVYPDADLLMPGLFDSVFSNISVTHTSAVLDERIQQLVDDIVP